MEPVERFGPFDLLARISTGGMAVTWLARRRGAAAEDVVAIKRILPAMAHDPELRALFGAEVEVAERLVHPNVVRTIEHGVIGGEWYLAMEYVWGEDLRHIARAARGAGRRLPVALAARVVQQAARGLHYAHTLADPATGAPLGLTHRDVSPPNVMVTFDGRVVVVDFGIAKVARQFQRVRAGQLKGKFGYMSPEQVQGLAVDARSDVFSLGVVLWEFTVGRRLFRGESDVETIAAVAAAEVPAPSAVVPGFDPALERIVLDALASDPDHRTGSAGALADALEPWLSAIPDADAATLGRFVRELLPDRRAELGRLGVPLTGPRPLNAPLPAGVRPDAPAPPPPATAGAAQVAARARSSSTPLALEPPMVPTPDPDSAPEHDPSPLARDARRTSRGIFAGVAFAVAVIGAVIAYQLATVGTGTRYFEQYVSDGSGLVPPDLPPAPPPPLLPQVNTAVTSEPAGAAIVVNGVATGAVTPADVALYASRLNTVSLHLDGYATEYVAGDGGAAIARTLTPFVAPPPEVDEEGTGDGSEGSGAAVDPGPGTGRGRLFVRVRNAAGERVPAEILINGAPVGSAPMHVSVPALQDQHVTVRHAGYRDSVTYARAVVWRDIRSDREVALELSPDAGDANRWSMLSVRPTPQDAAVRVGDDVKQGIAAFRLALPGPHMLTVEAAHYEPFVRVLDARLGQVQLNAVLAPVGAEAATLSLDVSPPGALVLIERVQGSQGGAEQIPVPSKDLPVTAGSWRIAIQYTPDGQQRIRSFFDVELAPGANELAYELEGSGFVLAE